MRRKILMFWFAWLARWNLRLAMAWVTDLNEPGNDQQQCMDGFLRCYVMYQKSLFNYELLRDQEVRS
ncbi:MAG: hypothetical protein ACR2PF_06715 [Rhizobiaceae bacterium]